MISSGQLKLNLCELWVTHIYLVFCITTAPSCWTVMGESCGRMVVVACRGLLQIGINWYHWFFCNAVLQLYKLACLLNTTTHTHSLHIPGVHLRANEIGSIIQGYERIEKNVKQAVWYLCFFTSSL